MNTESASSLTGADIDAAHAVFEDASAHGGLVAMSLEMPGPVAGRAVRAAARRSLRVVLDPGVGPARRSTSLNSPVMYS